MTSLLPVGPADPTRAGSPLAGSPLAEPLPLPEPGWGIAEARAAWRAALPSLPAEVLGELSGHVPVRVSALTTVVLRVGPWAVKVYPPATDAAHLARLVAALDGSTVAHLPVAPPVRTEHGTVTVTRWLDAPAPVGWPQVGELLARFHAEHGSAPLTPWQPLTRVASQAATLPPAAADVLLSARDELVAAVAATWSDLGWGAVHGDVSPENVIGDAAGPRLIDLDWTVVGPRELDLAPVARRYRTGEIDRSTYAGFCRAYGHDVRGWPGLPLVDRIAELGGLVFRIWDCRHHGRDLDWLDGELARWRHPL